MHHLGGFKTLVGHKLDDLVAQTGSTSLKTGYGPLKSTQSGFFQKPLGGGLYFDGFGCVICVSSV